MIHLLIVDDHELILEGLARLVETQEDMHLVAGKTSGTGLIEYLKTVEVDVLILDLSFPDQNGFELLKDIKAWYPDLKVLILSIHPEEHFAVRAFQNGASGYITKGTNSHKLLEAIRKIHAGGKYMTASLAEQIVDFFNLEKIQPPHSLLSDREFEILCLLGEGMSTETIAELLGISRNTVRTYRSRIIKKTGLKTTAEIIRYVIQYNLI